MLHSPFLAVSSPHLVLCHTGSAVAIPSQVSSARSPFHQRAGTRSAVVVKHLPRELVARNDRVINDVLVLVERCRHLGEVGLGKAEVAHDVGLKLLAVE